MAFDSADHRGICSLYNAIVNTYYRNDTLEEKVEFRGTDRCNCSWWFSFT